MLDLFLGNNFFINWLFDNIFDVLRLLHDLHNFIVGDNFSWYLYNLFNNIINMDRFLHDSLIVSLHDLRNSSLDNFLHWNFHNFFNEILNRSFNFTNNFLLINLYFSRKNLVRISLVLIDVLFVNGDDVVLINIVFHDVLNLDINKPLDWNLLDFLDVNWFLDNFLVRHLHNFLDWDLDDLLDRLLHDDLGDHVSFDDFLDWFLDDYIIRNLYFFDYWDRVFDVDVDWLLDDSFLDDCVLFHELTVD